MSTPPPTYAEALQEIERLKASGLSTGTLNAAYAAMTEKAAEPATTTQLLEEIEDLSSRVLGMDESFARIKVALGQLDNNKYNDKDGKPLEKMQPIWAEFQRVRRLDANLFKN